VPPCLTVLHVQDTDSIAGSPPEWNGRGAPFTLSPESRVQMVDQNGYRMQDSSPYIPVFAAVDALRTKVDWSSLDIITDRNALRKLMRWIGGTADKEFRFDLDLLGENTALLTRWEKRFREVPKYETYGFTFEEETTNAVQGCGDSTGHYRVVKYVCDNVALVTFCLLKSPDRIISG